jgi:hypothetical protein
MAARTLVIACGAIAKELVELKKRNGWEDLKIQCLPADWHMTPNEIPGGVRDTIEKYRDEYDHIYVAYADCGTGGLLDRVVEEYGVERIPGAHCYEFFAGSKVFFEYADAEPGTFYLTDYLVRHFDRLVMGMLGLEKHPELKEMYFGNYRKVVFLVQEPSEKLSAMAREQADYLGLEYEEHFTGLEPFGEVLREQAIKWRN